MQTFPFILVIYYTHVQMFTVSILPAISLKMLETLKSDDLAMTGWESRLPLMASKDILHKFVEDNNEHMSREMGNHVRVT